MRAAWNHYQAVQDEHGTAHPDVRQFHTRGQNQHPGQIRPEYIAAGPKTNGLCGTDSLLTPLITGIP